MGALKPWHWVVMVVLVVLLFGAGKLPHLARNLGKSMRIFKSEVDELKRESGIGQEKDEDDDEREYDHRAARKVKPAEPVEVVRDAAEDRYRRD
ncbi:Sec-independent protein translocase subunit TatA [Dermabacteraceae bacterium P13077]|nr:Sec-independent protein translocase subunit TatA [Dermabacteraceae bacterium TAE3-ERU5]